MYKVFTRNWWRYKDANVKSSLFDIDRNQFHNLEHDPGARRTTLHKNIETEDEARAICKEYQATHEPGRLSRKAEYEGQ